MDGSGERGRDRGHPDERLLPDCVRSVLERRAAHDWQWETRDFWCYVRPPAHRFRVQGWKLHLSATPLSAPLVLARAADVLVRHRCHFKFARDLDRVTELVSRACDRGSAGKFITVYPEAGDAALRVLAEELDLATEGLPGPGILSDRAYRPGSLVHYRYGVFHGMPVLGNEGSYEAMLVAPDGTPVLDQRRAWFSPPSWAPRDPFRPGGGTGSRASGPASAVVLLNGRYQVRQSLRQSSVGGVYRARDLTTGAFVIVKQGRPHTQATALGRDIRDARRHEAEMLRQFDPSGVTPRFVDLFEQQGDLFLVQEEIRGVTLRQWVADSLRWAEDGTWGVTPEDVARIAAELAGIVALVHDRGLVLRDLHPANVMVTEDGALRLIDLELLVRPGERSVSRGFTPGYGAPEQVAAPPIGTAPQPAADLYGLGATLFHVISGADPVLAADDTTTARPWQERLAHWLDRLAPDNAAVRRFGPLALALMHEDPGRRPGIDDVRRRITATVAAVPAPSRAPDVLLASAPPDPGASHPAESSGRLLARLLDDTLGHLVATRDPGSATWLWKPTASGRTSDPCNLQHGAAGVLGTLVRAYEESRDPALLDAVQDTVHWISGVVAREPRILPGLYFGRSGTAWALFDAGRALGESDTVVLAEDLARSVPLRWPNPDVCHGVAGAGLTQLRFWEVTGDKDFLDRARQAAEAVVEAAEHRGGRLLWPIPADFESRLAGLVHYGFAHGVAGAGTFLLAAGRATAEAAFTEAARKAADTLLSVARDLDGAACWPAGEGPGALRTHWCSGSSGVGTFLLRMWREDGDDRLRGLVHRAAVAVHRSRWHTGPSQCHGLSGDGEFLLDLADATGEDRYRTWARDLATGIAVRHVLRDGRVLPVDETGTGTAADFGTGLAGVAAFLHRLIHGGPRLWLPDHNLRTAQQDPAVRAATARPERR
ncbi:class IV lanthionine synthetase LanL [Streptomyces roseirectus]|uniref:non-specific serine/threonine protein kinase n=1 Tax=Streptomyces roseirectus TaxID=2768066 RepID=A0A7H0IQX8_9ACTN|nr:class IV lanthionine synthetase LanL [Streptomyces roseirectus]QNP75194.1 class IV lanthionine synthetase LanL [Streptomyces roseirectus]